MSTATHTFSFRPKGRAKALPTFAPMLALGSSLLPPNPKLWAFEYKWDGVRAVFYHNRASSKILARSGNDITNSYPELLALSEKLRGLRIVLDGEIVSLDELHRPSFKKLQSRMHVRNPSEALVAQTPVFYVVFDILFLNGERLVEQPYSVRRKHLEASVLSSDFSGIGPSHAGRGKVMLRTSADRGLEGIVAKRLDSIYLPGVRSSNWLKLKVIQRQEFVIGGWTPQEGSPDRVGSLLLGYHDDEKLEFAGRIGSGFSDEEHRRLAKLFKTRESNGNPFRGSVNRVRGTIFLKPELVAEVDYRRWPTGGNIQHGVYKGLRDDKDAKKVVKEHPQQAI